MLNEQQQKAVDSKSKKILCLAGAGTGKTHTMLARINKLVDDGVPTSKILVLTFTNAAAAEMAARYRKVHESRITPTFCTFHGFCYQLLVRDETLRSALGYSKVPNVPTEIEVKDLKVRVRNKCGTTLSNKKLEGAAPLTAGEQVQYDIFWKEYKRMLKESNFITFDIMCYDVCKLFEEDDERIKSYKERYEYIFVDEFQDTDPKQYAFVKSFEESNLFVVGDVKQAIYSFRGADSSIIKSLAKSDEWENIQLVQNYRSTFPICQFANTIGVEDNEPEYTIELTNPNPGPQVKVAACVDVINNGDKIKKVIQNLVANQDKEDLKKIAILLRTNAEVDSVKNYMSQLKIPYVSNNLDEDTINILKSIFDDDFLVAWLATKLPVNEYNNYIKVSTINSKYAELLGFIELYSIDERTMRYRHIQNAYDKVMYIRGILASELRTYQKCLEILNILKLPTQMISIDVNANSEDIIDYIISLVDVSSDADIYVGTIHSVKGLEFDTVLLLGVGGKSFRLTNEENRNLYYVGATRAKTNLIVHIDDTHNPAKLAEEGECFPDLKSIESDFKKLIVDDMLR